MGKWPWVGNDEGPQDVHGSDDPLDHIGPLPRGVIKVGMTRAEKVAEAARLRDQGLSYPQIGERLGVGQGTAYKWVNPDRQKVYAKRDWDSPEGKQRRLRWRESAAPCVDCGGKVSDPRRSRCRGCEGAHREDVARARCERFIELRREGLTNRQIAEREGVPDHVVNQQLYRAHSKYGLEVPAAKLGRPPKRVAA